jgi:hypothetical protein
VASAGLNIGRHSGRDTRALRSSICLVSPVTESWAPAPIALLISVALSSSPSSAAAATGGAVVDEAAMGVAGLLCEVQPAARMQTQASASAIRCSGTG